MGNASFQVDQGQVSDGDFADFVARHLAGELGDRECELLHDELVARPERREAFVAICLHARLIGSCVGLDFIGEEGVEIPADEEERLELPAGVAPISLNVGEPESANVRLAFGSLSSGWPTAYLVATLIFAIGAMIGAYVKVSSPGVFAWKRPAEAAVEPVGRITATDDCVWADAADAYACGSDVFQGRTIRLSSGMLEIVYKTGARVILQGPVAYDAESTNGGYLSAGKMTGKIKHAAAKGFAVRTPTAIVTDLGTEFGIEVDKTGATQSQVFRGSVRVQALTRGGKVDGEGQVLYENESVRVDGTQSPPEIVAVPTARSADFVREIPKRAVRVEVFDLVDVVAGGDGFSGRKGRGINPTNGRATAVPPAPDSFFLHSDGQYHPVRELPFVDGVFIPIGGDRSEQVDSMGHVLLDWIEPTNGRMYGYIWAGGKIPAEPGTDLRTILDGVDYAADGHGLIFLHANSGITFDLTAIRKANPGFAISRFIGMTGNTNRGNTNASVEVLIDGRSRFRRNQINGWSGAAKVAIPIAASDRFLTLISTQQGLKLDSNWIIFGDPRLELKSTESQRGIALPIRAPMEKGGVPEKKVRADASER